MIFNWFFIFNLDEFEATGLVSRTYDLILDGRGAGEFLVTKGNGIGITHEGIFLMIDLNEKSPFIFDGRAIYVDENQNVWFGFEVPVEN